MGPALGREGAGSGARRSELCSLSVPHIPPLQDRDMVPTSQVCEDAQKAGRVLGPTRFQPRVLHRWGRAEPAEGVQTLAQHHGLTRRQDTVAHRALGGLGVQNQAPLIQLHVLQVVAFLLLLLPLGTWGWGRGRVRVSGAGRTRKGAEPGGGGQDQVRERAGLGRGAGWFRPPNGRQRGAHGRILGLGWGWAWPRQWASAGDGKGGTRSEATKHGGGAGGRPGRRSLRLQPRVKSGGDGAGA